MTGKNMEYIRHNMVNELRKMGIMSGTLLEAMSRVPRELFVSEALRYRAYNDTSLPIGFGQTVSKPSVIARMIQALHLTGDERVLEIGTGSGYQSAVLAELAAHVVSIERIGDLSRRARDVLFSLRYKNVTLLHTDNFHETEGLFNGIIVAAGADILPDEIFSRLVNGGTLIIPLENERGHTITRYVKKDDNRILQEVIGEAEFVPLIRTQGA